jgi:hypothetical protein
MSDDAMGIPGWSEFQAARQSFLDRLAADAAGTRRAPHGPADATDAAALGARMHPKEEERECPRPHSPLRSTPTS